MDTPSIQESSPGVYEFTVVSDLSQILRGEHFATLLWQQLFMACTTARRDEQ
jgi:hypothetical protein